MARPRPRPPWVRAGDWSPCLKRSKTNGRKADSIPQPVSLTSTRKPSPLAPRDDADRAPWRCELDRVRQQIPEHLAQPVWIPGHRRHVGCHIDAQSDVLGLRRQLHGFSGFVEDRLEIHAADVEAQIATHDTRDVDEVVDDDRLCARAALERVERLSDAGCVHPPAFQELNPSHDSGHRRPQFVRQRREELVFCAVGRVGRRTRLLLPTQQGLALRFYRLPLADVSKRPNHTLDFLIFVADIREALLDGTPAPILPDQHVFADHAVLRQRVRGRVRRITGGDRLQPKYFAGVPSPRRGVGPTGKPLGFRIEERDAIVDVREQHAICGAAECRRVGSQFREPCTALAKPLGPGQQEPSATISGNPTVSVRTSATPDAINTRSRAAIEVPPKCVSHSGKKCSRHT